MAGTTPQSLSNVHQSWTAGHCVTHVPCTQSGSAHLPSRHALHVNEMGQSALVVHWFVGGVAVEQVSVHWPLMQSGCAQLPSRQGVQICGSMQSLAAVH
jgi:hypothetical protein